MSAVVITQITARDARFPLAAGAGSDAVHSDPVYSFAAAEIATSAGIAGTGLTLTLGEGNDLVCRAIERLAVPLVGREIEDLMADYGRVLREMADHPQLRWLGPHKGVVYLALASLTNGLFDLWAKARDLPLWRLLLDLTPEQIVRLLDLSYLEDVLTAEDARAFLDDRLESRPLRARILHDGYPGYDTSAGWYGYSDERIREEVRRAVAQGFTALKLKVGSPDAERDLARARLIRDAAGPDVRLMLDANQQWSVPRALEIGRELQAFSPFWIEEPTHPDDVLGHQTLAHALAPTPIALGEHVPHRVLFKNFMQAGAVRYVQADCTRLAGVSEFLAVSLLASRFGLPVVPHVGDMGQIHQHLVLFNRIALDQPVVFLEHIPHLKAYFRHPAQVKDGVYTMPQEPGASTDLF